MVNLIAFFRQNIKTINLLATKILFIYTLSSYMFDCLVILTKRLIRTKRNGDIEQNPGPIPSSCQRFFTCA